MRNHHLDYFIQLTESAEKHLIRFTALNWIYRLEAEYDDLRAAFEWGMENNVSAILKMSSWFNIFGTGAVMKLKGANGLKKRWSMRRVYPLSKAKPRAIK